MVHVLLLSLALSVHADSPEETVRRMTPASGFAVKLVAAEPLVRKPVAIEFDDRGRLWVIQYLQYPNPAGLTRVQVDRYSRTVYDRVPEPPPFGPKGADRITILEDFDANGRARRAKDFVSDLNLATGLAFGHGGVFVLQAPYLLFYRDRDRNDVPDGPPQVLLSGFGMEDAHSLANSLTWGPDGWLYGCQGSTVTARIRGIEFQQGVWRYHPITHRFELFCEGGGNTWGLDFDRHGELLYSTNYGGFIMMHGVQGSYHWKQFGKHGALHNPFAYGFFDHVPHRDFHGGHVTVGGTVYQGAGLPERFRGKYIAADLLGHNVYWHHLDERGSTFASAHGGELLRSNDPAFAPSDLTAGPDGAIYVADWHDRRTAHPDPDAEWDRSGGRIYRIESEGSKRVVPMDLPKLSSAQLVAMLSHADDWYVRKARRLLADRRDPEVIFPLRTLVMESKDDHLALESLWALYVSGGFEESFALKLLGHRNPDVRRWTVRLLGDEERISPAAVEGLLELAAREPSVRVRSQLACTAKRLSAAAGLAIAEQLMLRNIDDADPYLPLLLWWAVETHALAAPDKVLARFANRAAWHIVLCHDVILPRLMRRYAAAGTAAGYDACAALLAAGTAPQTRRMLLEALDQGLSDRPDSPGPGPGTLFSSFAAKQAGPGGKTREEKLSAALEQGLSELWKDDTADTTLIRVWARLGHAEAFERALALATAAGVEPEKRLNMLRLLAEAGKPGCIGPLLKMVGSRESEAFQLAALGALQSLDQEEIASALLDKYPSLNARLRAQTVDVLLSRPRWARALLEDVDGGKIAAKEISVDQLRPIVSYHDKVLDALTRKHWGNITRGTPEEKLAEMRRLNNDLRADVGDPTTGRVLFQKHCASCHRLFGEGTELGPDLTHANRLDRDYLLASIVDPSAVIRKEYVAYTAQTTDGRVLTGLLVEQAPNQITLLDAKNQRISLPRSKVASLEESPVSLMPENLLKELRPQELRDLFAYLQRNKP